MAWALLAAALWTGWAGALHAEASRVIVLSWDGTRHDQPDRATTPALDRLARDGVRAGRLTPVFPSNTFPAHVSLATGTTPDVHGIVGNVFDDERRGRFDYSNDASWIEAEPLWAAAERQGVRSAVFFWPGSETDWRGVGATRRRAPFDAGIHESEKVDQILAWLDLPEPERPRLILSWWHGGDGEGHARGPDHPAVARQLARQDEELARLLRGLDARGVWPHTTLLLLSDHGMAEATRTLDVPAQLAARGIQARLQPGGAMGFVTLSRPEEREAALAVLGQVPGLRAFDSRRLPEGLRAGFPGRSGHLTVVADLPLALQPPPEGQLLSALRRWLGSRRGVHGYDPAVPEMGAIFYAAGRGVAADLELPEVRAIDVAPTVSRLLGMEPPAQATGRPIDGIGSPGRPR